MERVFAVVDSLGMCKFQTIFFSPHCPYFEEWSKLIYYITGLDISPEELREIGERAYTIERLFNIREGLTRNDLRKGDMLNHRYFDEPCRRGAPDVIGAKIDRKKFAKMIDEFYEYKGLDKEGVPKPATLKRLGLTKEPSHVL